MVKLYRARSAGIEALDHKPAGRHTMIRVEELPLDEIRIAGFTTDVAYLGEVRRD